MSEEIIRNGVNGVECKFLYNGRRCDRYNCIETYGGYYVCEETEYENWECDYKQLKRLQAENERLKEENEAYKNSIIANHDRAIGKRLEEVLEENEELKKIIETQNPWYNCKNCNKDYRQALEEIREMCSNTCEKNKDCIHSCYECKSIDEPVAINRILNKINEVLK